MYPESALLPISALQHLLFCERQCALIHVEQVWAENYLTVQGQHLHKKAHEGRHETRQGVRVARGLVLRSLRLGLVGKADVVEFHGAVVRGKGFADAAGPAQQAGPVVPIEYKRGRPKKEDSDRVQLCAQALCLEEMLQVEIARGEIFYGRTRRRTSVEFDARLRAATETACRRLHELVDSRRTPLARREPKCDRCSLFEVCMPSVVGLERSALRVVERSFVGNVSSAGPTTDDLADVPSR